MVNSVVRAATLPKFRGRRAGSCMPASMTKKQLMEMRGKNEKNITFHRSIWMKFCIALAESMLNKRVEAIFSVYRLLRQLLTIFAFFVAFFTSFLFLSL